MIGRRVIHVPNYYPKTTALIDYVISEVFLDNLGNILMSCWLRLSNIHEQTLHR